MDWETDIVNEFRRDADRREIVGQRDTPLGPSLYLSHPIRISNEACLACHTTAEMAPPAMLAAYPSWGGFGWKLNETIGAQIVQVPMSTPIRMANQAYRTLLLHLVVIRPVRRLSSMADRVSRGDLDVEEMTITGRDEVAELSGSFNRMRISLVTALKMLEND